MSFDKNSTTSKLPCLQDAISTFSLCILSTLWHRVPFLDILPHLMCEINIRHSCIESRINHIHDPRGYHWVNHVLSISCGWVFVSFFYFELGYFSIYETKFILDSQGCSHGLFPKIIVFAIKPNSSDENSGRVRGRQIIGWLRCDDKDFIFVLFLVILAHAVD